MHYNLYNYAEVSSSRIGGVSDTPKFMWKNRGTTQDDSECLNVRPRRHISIPCRISYFSSYDSVNVQALEFGPDAVRRHGRSLTSDIAAFAHALCCIIIDHSCNLGACSPAHAEHRALTAARLNTGTQKDAHIGTMYRAHAEFEVTSLTLTPQAATKDSVWEKPEGAMVLRVSQTIMLKNIL